MSELQTMETPKSAGFVDPNFSNANKRRIQEQEEELKELMCGIRWRDSYINQSTR